MPVVSALSQIENFASTLLYTSVVAQQQVATEMALRGLPIARRLVCTFQRELACSIKRCFGPTYVQTVSGYTIHFVNRSHQAQPPWELKFSKEEQQSLREEIWSMQSKHATCISKVMNPHDKQGFTSQLFLVPQKDGSWRPVTKPKQLNSFEKFEHFELESIHNYAERPAKTRQLDGQDK